MYLCTYLCIHKYSTSGPLVKRQISHLYHTYVWNLTRASQIMNCYHWRRIALLLNLTLRCMFLESWGWIWSLSKYPYNKYMYIHTPYGYGLVNWDPNQPTLNGNACMDGPFFFCAVPTHLKWPISIRFMDSKRLVLFRWVVGDRPPYHIYLVFLGQIADKSFMVSVCVCLFSAYII